MWKIATEPCNVYDDEIYAIVAETGNPNIAEQIVKEHNAIPLFLYLIDCLDIGAMTYPGVSEAVQKAKDALK